MVHLTSIQFKQWSKHLPIASILFLSFIFNIVGITWGLPNYIDWAPDSIAPYDTLRAISQRFSHGWWDYYPPMHYALLTVFYVPLMGYLMLTGGLKTPSQVFPFGLEDPLSTLTNLILISRVVSVLMGVAIVFLVYLTVRELFDRRSALFAALIVTLYHPLVYYAHNANVDVPYLFWSMLAIYYFLQVLKQGRLKFYICFALFGTLAICTKDQAYGLFLLAPLPIFWIRFAEQSRDSLRRLSLVSVILDRRNILAVSTAVVTFAVVQNLLLNFPGFVEHVQFITGGGRVDYVTHPPTLIGRLRLFWNMLVLLNDGLTLPLFALCAVGLVYCALKFPKYSLPLLFLLASYYILFLNVSLQMKVRFVLPIGIILAFFGGKLLAELWSSRSWKILTRTAICLAFAYAALFPIQLDYILITKDPRYAAERWIQEHVSNNAIVETFAPHRFHKYYPRFPSWVKVRSSQLEMGTQWTPLTTKPNKVFLPNLSTGGGNPNVIVLSSLWYDRFLDAEAGETSQAQFLRDLFQNRTDYTLAATFKTTAILPMSIITINPRIDIFKRPE